MLERCDSVMFRCYSLMAEIGFYIISFNSKWNVAILYMNEVLREFIETRLIEELLEGGVIIAGY